ncbi:MAG: molybdopterin cofactor-binding domain-containing protein [Gemmatimonas sp.]
MATVMNNDLSRRGFLKGAATTTAGLSFYLTLGTIGGTGVLTLASAARADEAAKELGPWVRVAPDGTITILNAGAEMGQGSSTSVPLILAEEMDADWNKVKLEWAPAIAELYGYGPPGKKQMSITGSRAVMMYYPEMRIAGAQVRKVLIANAAQKWNVAAATLTTEPGFVVNPASGQKLSYGEIASFGTVPESMPEVKESELKDPSTFRLIGKTQPRRDIPGKVNGSAQFAIDVQLPGMVYATTLHSPAQGGEAESWNDADVKKLKGVLQTVKVPNGVAVVADTYEAAMAGRKALRVTWKPGKSKGFDSEKALDEKYLAIHADEGFKVQTLDKHGDDKKAFGGAAKTYKAGYRAHFAYHAQMEPLNATARFNEAGDRVEVWDGSQSPDRARADIAKALGFKEEQVTHNQCYMGGGFGRRSLGDYAAEAALVARDAKKPVKLIWTREEDLANGMFRPQNYQCLEAATDNAGKVVGWRHCIVGDGGAALLATGIKINEYYEVPNQNIELRGVSEGIKTKHWRSVANPFNQFAIEAFIDEIAADQKMDPIEFRLKNMATTDRTRKVFEAVAKMSDWGTKRPSGRGLGVALSERSGSLGAGVVEISLDQRAGRIRVHKVWLAVDGGLVVQPDAALANIESGILYGLSNALYEEVTVKDGMVQQSNFHEYNLLRMSDLPEEMHIEFVPSDLPPKGLGEIGNPWLGAAIANAFFQITGKRIYEMPFTEQQVLETMRA